MSAYFSDGTPIPDPPDPFDYSMDESVPPEEFWSEAEPSPFSPQEYDAEDPEVRKVDLSREPLDIDATVSDCFAGLSDEQKDAANFSSGVRVLSAGPGSGKTRTIISHCAHLLNMGVDPNSILMSTFTRAARNEMFERISEAHPRGREVNVNTLHSVFMRFLNRFSPFPDRVKPMGKLDDLQRKYFAEQAGVTQKQTGVRIGALSDALGHVKNDHTGTYEELLEALPSLLPAQKDIQQAIAQAKNKDGKNSMKVTEEEYFKRCVIYQEMVFHNGWFDYDDVFPLIQSVAAKNPYHRMLIGDRYKHLCIDEVQDLTASQHAAIRLMWGQALKSTTRSCLMVGDVDQSIYAFRSARPDEMVRVATSPGVESMQIRNTYRSRQEIISMASDLIGVVDEGSEIRVDLRPVREEGAHIKGIPYSGHNDEMIGVVKDISRKIRAGASPSDFAIISPSLKGYIPAGDVVPDPNAIFLPKLLDERGIPYKIGERNNSVHTEVSAFLLFSELLYRDNPASNPEEFLGVLDLILAPFKGVGAGKVRKKILDFEPGLGEETVTYLGILSRVADDEVAKYRAAKERYDAGGRKTIPTLPMWVNPIRFVAEFGRQLREILVHPYTQEWDSFKKDFTHSSESWANSWVSEVKNYIMDGDTSDPSLLTGPGREFVNRHRAGSLGTKLEMFFVEFEKNFRNTTMPEGFTFSDPLGGFWEGYTVTGAYNSRVPLKLGTNNADISMDPTVLCFLLAGPSVGTGFVSNFREFIDMGTELETEEGKVTITTCHSAKGLEFSDVYLIGMSGNQFPFSSSEDREALTLREFSEPDNIRTIFVAITRAKNNLTITWPNSPAKWIFGNQFVDFFNSKGYIKVDDAALPGGSFTYGKGGSYGSW